MEEKNKMTGKCPECWAEVTLVAGTEKGEIVVCPDCAVELEVRCADPVVLELAPETEEDTGE